jgi:threonylcarbamoyladenosine tRNA methylthiotransferase CDKAL1
VRIGLLQEPVNFPTPTPKFLFQDETSNERQTMPPKVFLRNYGCSANTADTQTLAGCLKRAGIPIATTETEAEVLIYNTCAVKGPTENRVINDLKAVPKTKKIIVAGCLPKISFERLLREVRFDGAVGPGFGVGIVDVVLRVAAGERVVMLDAEQCKPQLDLPQAASNPFVSIVPVSYGCLGNCAYCCVTQARGHLRSCSVSEVLERVLRDYACGAREFWLTSQDMGCYGRDLHVDLAELLGAVGGLAGDFHVRVGMMTPNMVGDMQQRLIDAYGNPKIFKFAHLPVQSGDDAVLQYMRRFYTVQEFKGVVDAFRANFRDLTLATDVIVGFPGETVEAFENTLRLLEEIKFDVVNVSKFFARPKTVAARLRDGLVEKEEIKRRSAVAAEVAKRVSLEKNSGWVGWMGWVFVDEKGKVEGTWVGRNFAYKPVAVKSKENLLGKTVKAQVTQATATYLKANIQEN